MDEEVFYKERLARTLRTAAEVETNFNSNLTQFSSQAPREKQIRPSKRAAIHDPSRRLRRQSPRVYPAPRASAYHGIAVLPRLGGQRAGVLVQMNIGHILVSFSPVISALSSGG